MSRRGATVDPWQQEADLLADGRERLESLCGAWRLRHLYPVGADPALLLLAYQELDRRRALGSAGRSIKGDRRILRRTLETLVRRDALARDLRLLHRLPAAAPAPVRVLPPPVMRALEELEPSEREIVQARLRGEGEPDEDGSTATVASERTWQRFRDALLSSLLSNPASIAALHPQLVALLASPQPRTRRYPLATLLLIKLPLQLVLLVFTLLNLAYLGAYYFFNDEVLGRFVSSKVSGLLEGELEMRSIHWDGRLILDLLTGEPSPVVVEGITVYEPYKSFGGERRATAHVERVEATLVLHEIIPWNRLAIPAMFEVPWILHFGEADIQGDSWFRVRAYRDTHDARGEVTLLGLRDAFSLYDPKPNDRRGLSFAVDHASLEHVDVDVDYRALSGWRFDAGFDRGEFGLRFVAVHPSSSMPRALPLSFDLHTDGGAGELLIDDIWLPLTEFEDVHLYGGTGDADWGDVRYDGRARAAGSLVDLDGVLRYALSRDRQPGKEPLPYGSPVVWGPAPVVELRAATRDVGDVLAHTLEQLELPESSADGSGAAAIARIEGPLSEPVYHLAAEGLVLDPLDEPAWAVDDARLSVRMTAERAPERWGSYYDGPRLVAQFDAFEGSALDGTVHLRDGAIATVVLPDDEREPMLLDGDFDLTAINPAQLVPDDPATAAMLAGVASGRVRIDELRLGPVVPDEPGPGGVPPPPEFGMQLARLELGAVTLVRDHGPGDDGFPRTIGAAGTVTIDEHGAITWDDLRLGTDGATLLSSGAIDGSFASLRNTSLALDIDDGAAFSRALGLPQVVDELSAKLVLGGPLGAPTGSGGQLSVRPHAGAVLGQTNTRLWLDRGVLHLAGDDVRLLGARGEVDVAIDLFERGEPTADPRIRAWVDLDGVDLGALTSGEIEGLAKVELDVGDGGGKAARLSELRVAGSAEIPQLRYGGTQYRDAQVAFRWAEGELAVEQLVLPLHRRTSPAVGVATDIEVGRIVADGTVGLVGDPALDLHVVAHGVPLDVVGAMVGSELPMRGQIGRGTELDVTGTLSRPAVEGKVALVGLSAYGIALGSGALEIDSDDAAAAGPLSAHRELWAKGELSTGERKGGRIDWSIDAVVAIGKTTRPGEQPPVAAQVDVGFDRIALPLVLAATGTPWPGLEGELEGLSAHVLTCDTRGAMLSDCAAAGPLRERSLALSLSLDRGWLRGRTRSAVAQQQRLAAKDPCTAAGTLCAEGLQATLDGDLVRLERPLALRSPDGARAELAGSLDLSAPIDAPPGPAPSSCRAPPPPPPRVAAIAHAESTTPGHATLRGTVALSALQAVLQPLGFTTAKGAVALDLSLDGPVRAPAVAGRIDLGAAGESLWLQPAGVPTPLEFTDLAIGVSPQWLSARGELRVYGETLAFGSVAGARTGVAFAGPCAGHFDVAAHGTLGVRLLSAVLGEAAAGAQGGIDVREAIASGTLSPFSLEQARGTLAFTDHDLQLGAIAGLETITLQRGEIHIARCGSGHDCSEAAGVPDGAIAIEIGPSGAPTPTAPAAAVTAAVGARGEARLWGRAYLDGSSFTPLHTELDVRLDDVTYRDYDARGRPVAEAELSCPRLSLRGADPIVVEGDIELARARYVKDVTQGTDILAVTDDVEVAESPPPEIIRNLQFDLRLETDDPLRLENNVATGIEANVDVAVAGTYDAPELAGRIEFESGGRVDLPFLTGTYELQRGRVNLLGPIEDAEVDLLALRQEPIYVDAQPRQLQLQLDGTLDEIHWRCLTVGDTSAAQQTARSCFDYLVLGTGDVQVSEADVRRFGGGGLAEARKPLQVVGHVTEFDLDERAAKAVPRARGYVPDMRLRLGQIGPELQIATPRSWFDFDYGRASFGWDYTRGYPGFFLRQSRQLTFKLELLEPITLEFSRRIRSYLNQRVVFDPLTQRTLELRFDVSAPSAR